MVLSGPDVPMIMSRPHYLADKECGYCHGSKEKYFALESFHKNRMPSIPEKSGSITIGCHVEQMSCKQYDELINQGFRRSGRFLYKPDLLRSCCRLYSIRTNLKKLKINKQHRQTINRFIRAISEENQDLRQSGKKQGEKFDLDSLIKAEKTSTKFYTRFEQSIFTTEKFELYKKYQAKVHNDNPEDITKKSFERFLCDSPFLSSEIQGSAREWNYIYDWVSKCDEGSVNGIKRIGPAHECYYMDDKLIAISVLDFLPSGVSSIYFIWDPDYAHLSLGTLSGLREIIMCNKLKLGWYYLGYYIDDCVKMRYKSKFGGEILDVCNEVYFPLEVLQDHLKDGKLFVMGEKDDDHLPEHELEIENTGSPCSVEDSDFDKKSLINISEHLYGNELIYKDSEKALAILKAKYGIGNNYESEAYSLPNVIPGVIPLWQILEWFDNGVIDDEFPVCIFTMVNSKMNECTFGELNGTSKSLIIDCIRLFGLEKVQDSIIIC